MWFLAVVFHLLLVPLDGAFVAPIINYYPFEDQISITTAVLLSWGRPPRESKFPLNAGSFLPYVACDGFRNDSSDSRVWHTSFTLNSVDGGNVTVPRIYVQCTGRRQKFPFQSMEIGPSNLSLPLQLASAQKMRVSFAYCLPSYDNFNYTGSFFVGSTSLFTFNKMRLEMLKIPMKIKPESGYYIRLTALEMENSSFIISLRMQASVSQTYTSLPGSAFSFLRDRLFDNFGKRNISQVFVSDIRDSAVNVCFKMTAKDVVTSPVLTLVFSNRYRWELPPSRYMVPYRGDTMYSIFCIGFFRGVEPALGTFQQQDNILEFDHEKGTLGISGPLKGENACAQTSHL